MSTVVLYCCCHSGGASVLLYFTFSSVSHIPYYVNFRLNNGPDMSSFLTCFLRQLVILEACSCSKNDRVTVNLVNR